MEEEEAEEDIISSWDRKVPKKVKHCYNCPILGVPGPKFEKSIQKWKKMNVKKI